MQLNIHHSPDLLLQRFRYFFAEIPTRNHNRSSWQNRSQRPQTDWMVSIIFRKIHFQPPVVWWKAGTEEQHRTCFRWDRNAVLTPVS